MSLFPVSCFVCVNWVIFGEEEKKYIKVITKLTVKRANPYLINIVAGCHFQRNWRINLVLQHSKPHTFIIVICILVWCKHGKTPLDKICTSTYDRGLLSRVTAVTFIDIWTMKRSDTGVRTWSSEHTQICVRTSPKMSELPLPSFNRLYRLYFP